MARIYRSVVDEVNKRTFDCLVPVSYFRRIPDDRPHVETVHEVMGSQYGVDTKTTIIRGPTVPTSFYNPVNTNQREQTKIAIPDMVDIYIKKVYCQILNDLDVIHILHLVDEYLLAVEQQVKSRIPEYVRFVENLCAFRADFIYPCFRRNLFKYPNLLEEYRTYDTGLNNVWLKLFGIENEHFNDGIDKLRNPPYDVEAYIHPPEHKEMVTGIDGKPVEEPQEDEFYSNIFKLWGGDK